MDLNDLTWRLGLATSNIEMQRALEAVKASKLFLDQSRAYTNFAPMTSSAQIAAEINGLTDFATLGRERLMLFDAAASRAAEMLDGRAAIEAAKSSMGIEQHLAALRPHPALEDLFAAARQPLYIEDLVREASLVRQRLETVMGRDLFAAERVLDSLRQGSTIIGAFDLPDLDTLEPQGAGYLDDDDSPAVIMPEEAHNRLLRVEFLPVRLIHEIRHRPEMMRVLSPRDFERMTAELLSGLGFENIVLTPRSRDGGRDVVAVHRVRGIPVLFAFECKKYTKRRIQLDILRGLLGTVVHGPTTANIGVLVTTSRFTSGARKFILSEARIDGKDFDDLVEWLREYRRR